MPLRLLAFLGSTRESAPPRPARLGVRVAAACLERLAAKGAEADLVDPLELPLAPPFKPQFAYAEGEAPPALDALAAEIEAADGYVMISPEYNHAMSPALAHLLNHFGASRFAYKPSLIVTYSSGQWGGARAAVNMRTFLSELGCLPVSAMIHIPHAQDVLDADGRYLPTVDAERWRGYLDRGFDQLEWWAEAARARRKPGQGRATAFLTTPSERDAP